VLITGKKIIRTAIPLLGITCSLGGEKLKSLSKSKQKTKAMPVKARVSKKTNPAKKRISKKPGKEVKTTSKPVSRPKSRKSKEVLKKYRKMLLKKREELIGEVKYLQGETLNKSQREAAGDLSSYSIHPADQATDTYDRQLSIDLASSEGRIIRDIDAALKKIKEKTFGACETCGKRINAGRLKILPYALHCFKCQEKNEIE